MNDLIGEKEDRLKVIQLLGELRKLGYKFDNPNQLKSLKLKDKKLIPLLLKYLHEFKASNFKDWIVGALKVKGFNDATEDLIKEFFTAANSKVDKWSIGDAFSVIQDKRFEDQYINIVKNKNYGTDRQMVVIALGKIKSEKALPTLLSLLEDEDINGHVVMALGYYKKTELVKYLTPFLDHMKTWIKKEAKKSIAKIEKAALTD